MYGRNSWRLNIKFNYNYKKVKGNLKSNNTNI